MSDVSGAAPAAPVPEAAPAPLPDKPSSSAREAVDRAFSAVDREEAQPPRPVSSQTQPEPKPEPKPAKAEKTADAAKPAEKSKPLEKAEPKAEAKAEPKPGPSRAADGKFASAEPVEAAEPATPAPKASGFPDPPKRFSEDARSAWNDAPEPVRAEIHRATRELEEGLQKYRGDAAAFEEVRPFADLAKSQGTTLKEAMSRYVGIEQMLRKDFIGGLEAICQNKGVSLKAVAAQIMGQKPEEGAARQDQTIAALRQQVESLSKQVGGVSKTIEQQRTDSVMQSVTQFASETGHERFEELAQDIQFFLQTGRAPDLQQAYELAARLNPAPARPAATPAPTPPAKTDDAAQTRKGSLAVHGAPSSGSDPATRKTPSSARNAVDEAFARLGL